MGTIKGRPIVDINERAPSYHNEILKDKFKQYQPPEIVKHILYLISDTPISKSLWLNGGYNTVNFEVDGEDTHLMTNSGSESCMKEVIAGNLDISDWIWDLVCLCRVAFQDVEGIFPKDRPLEEQMQELLDTVHSKLKNGIERTLIA